MSLSDVELCNAALVKIGARPIAGFADAGAEALCAGRLYPIIRDALLSAHPWSFTLAQATLLPQVGEPVADYGRSFALPADHLRTISAGYGGSARGLSYRIQGTLLLASSDAVVIAYQRRAEEGTFPAFFVQALVTRLAAEFCVPLTEGTARASDLYQIAQAELRAARALDSQQSTPRRIEDFTLIEARF